jgi:endonuclease/exonuclease/phosphatase family metal-dependent hydrolase
LHALVGAPFGRLPVFVTHLDWEFDHGWVRERQVAAIVERVQSLASAARSDFPAILMGDFNAEPEADEIRYLRGRTSRLGRSVWFADCFALTGDGSPGYTFARSNRFAATQREPDRRIDYIFVRGQGPRGEGEPLSARVVFTSPSGDLFPTDHYGVYAELRATAAISV